MKLPVIKKVSIAKKMMVPMLLVLLIQTGLFLGAILYGGTLRQLNNNAFDILNERVINRQIALQNLMIQQWSNCGDTVQRVNSVVQERLLENGMTAEELVAGNTVTNEILSTLTEDMILMMRRNGVTDAFLVLDGAGRQNRYASRAGICLRDYSPGNAPMDNSDLLAARGPAEISEEYNIALDTNWQPQFTFSAEDSYRSSFYFMPYDAAIVNRGVDYKDLGYWSRPYQLDPQETKRFSYSVPLLLPDGTPYGVFGASINLDYLTKVLPYSELDQHKDAAYVLALDSADTLEVLFSSGPAYQRIFGAQSQLWHAGRPHYGDTYAVGEAPVSGEPAVYGSIHQLKLYNSNTPFEDDHWVLVGLEDAEQLLSFSRGVEVDILWSLGASLLLGIICLVFISRISTKSIAGLVQQVKQSNPNLPVRFDKTGIYEIDELAFSIEHLSRNVSDSASKLSRIIELTSLSIGAFEADVTEGSVFLTNRFFSIFGLPDVTENYLPLADFEARMLSLTRCIESNTGADGVYVFRTEPTPGNMIWVRLRVVVGPERTLGVVEDITQEMVEKRKLEYERDYDLLTNLLNRRAFHRTMESLFQSPGELGIAALVMLDLDNLKYINDTYGHDYGDQYIYCMAQILKKNTPRHAVLSRMSGDEFYVFLYGYTEQEQVRAIIQDIRGGILQALFPLPGDSNFRVRASAGVAWYPADSSRADELIRFADFAMYTVKNTVKGEFAEFDSDTYQKDSYLLQGREALNKLIDEQLLDFHFQPIVDARTGAVFAYESLMRPRMNSLKSPLEILTLARAQSKLYQIERLTLFLSMRSFLHFTELPADCYIFINSIASQILTAEDLRQFQQRFAPHLGRIVLEMTEEERNNDDFTAKKQDYLRRWHAQLALDDYGSGYNGDTALLRLNPDYVKLDMSIVRNIDSDENRLKILQNLISYTRERHIKVIAEGVETRLEMLTLIENGVDFLQGYYLGRPTAAPQTPSARVVAEICGAQRPTADSPAPQ